jgi:hypothetical protein
MIFKPTGLMGTYDFSLSRLIGRSADKLSFKKAAPKKAAPKEGDR